jgi:hypothetical protein
MAADGQGPQGPRSPGAAHTAPPRRHAGPPRAIRRATPGHAGPPKRHAGAVEGLLSPGCPGGFRDVIAAGDLRVDEGGPASAPAVLRATLLAAASDQVEVWRADPKFDAEVRTATRHTSRQAPVGSGKCGAPGRPLRPGTSIPLRADAGGELRGPVGVGEAGPIAVRGDERSRFERRRSGWFTG